MNFIDPPEGILDPERPWHLPMPKSPGLWGVLKARLTGRRNEYGDYSSYVNISEADAERLFTNMRKDPRGYPQLDQSSGSPSDWMDRQRRYQEWLVEAYLEIPFREEVDKKIEERQIESRINEINEEKRKKAAEVAETINVDNKISPEKFIPKPASIPDPWEGSATVPQGVKPNPDATQAGESVTPSPTPPPPSPEQEKASQGILPKIEGFGLLEGLSVQLVQLKETLNGTKENISSLKKESDEHITILSKLAETLKDGIELKQKLKQQEDINKEKDSVDDIKDTSGYIEPDRGLDREEKDSGGGPFDFLKRFLDMDDPDIDLPRRRRRRGVRRRALRRRFNRAKGRIRLPKFGGKVPKFKMPNIRVPSGASKFFGGAARLGGRGLQILNIPVLGDMILPEGTSQYDQMSGPNAYYNAPGYKGNKPKEYERGGVAKGSKSGFTAILHGREAVIPMGGSRTFVKSGGKYEIGNVQQVLQKSIGENPTEQERQVEKKKKEQDDRIFTEAVSKGLMIFEKKKPMDILRKLLGATGENMFNFWKRIFAAAWNGIGEAAKALINFARKIGGGIVSGLFQTVQQTTQNITDNITALGESLTGGTKAFASVSGTSGSVAYGGKTNARISAAYTPFSQADVRSKGISIISGKGYRGSTGTNHKGYDLAAPSGTPLYAYLPGTVTDVLIDGRGDGGYGNGIEWKDSVYGQTHFFGHMVAPTPFKKGSKINQGVMLGKVGSTGVSQGPHLHWEIGGFGSQIDPGAWTKANPLPEVKPPPAKPSPKADPTEGVGATTIINNIASATTTVVEGTQQAMSMVQNALNPLSTLKALSLIK